MELRENEIFDGKYRLLKQLGSGGFAVVWLAEDVTTKLLKVALKIYTPGQFIDEKHFFNSLQLVFNLNHQNVLPPRDYGKFEGMLYLVMLYSAGGSCEAAVGKMNESDAWRFLSDVAGGLSYLHRKNIIHQDIKPANILISDDALYMITDFDVSARAKTTVAKNAVEPEAGTKAYMAPERFDATAAPIMASDIWALGASLAELLTGDLPFGEMGGLNQKSGAPMSQKGRFSKYLKAIITLCLQLETWNRPTADEIFKWCSNFENDGKVHFSKKYRKMLGISKRVRIVNAAKKISKPALLLILTGAVVFAGIKIAPSLKSVVPKNSASTTSPTIPISSETPTPAPPSTPTVVIAPSQEDLAKFNDARKEALDNYDFAVKKNDSNYYPDALYYCNEALKIKPDDPEMKELKEKIESKINK
jgi:serine/threonine protein kinase